MLRVRPFARRWLVLAGAAAIWLSSAFGAPGYRFLFTSYHDPRMAIDRWDPEVWPAGDTLSAQFVDSPDWALIPGVEGSAHARRIAIEALAAWSATASADIRWEVGPTVPPGGLDTHRGMGIGPGEDRPTGTYIGATATAAGWLIHSCIIHIRPSYPFHSETDLLKVLLHEAGHCLGLGHPARYPRVSDDLDGRIDPQFTLWSKDPLMSYGVWRKPYLTADDRIGASLIRPRPGWKETTGTITGAVFSGLEPAPYVNVLAIRICLGGRLCEGVGAFTGPTGGFAVEGLSPGRYILWVYPLKVPSAIRNTRAYWEIGATHVEDAILARPVEVRAGGVTGPVFVRLRPHEGRPS